MVAAPIRVDVGYTDDGFVVRLIGELDVATAPQVQQAVDAVFRDEARWRTVVFDLNELSFIDAHGASVLVHAHDLARRRGTELVVTNLRGEPALLFRAAGLDHLLATANEAIPTRPDRRTAS